MIPPVAGERIFRVNGAKDIPESPPAKSKINNTVVISKVDVETEKADRVPRDQVGINDNLTALYWG